MIFLHDNVDNYNDQKKKNQEGKGKILIVIKSLTLML